MNDRISRLDQVKKLSRTPGERLNTQYRRPFWLPVASYYALAAVASAAFFLFVWVILREGYEQSPMIAAIIGAGFVLGISIVVREIFLKNPASDFF